MYIDAEFLERGLVLSKEVSDRSWIKKGVPLAPKLDRSKVHV